MDIAVGTGAGFLVGAMLDTGSAMNRMPAWVAREAGIDLAGATEEEAGVGGIRTRARIAVARLELPEGTWEAPVAFCDPWPWTFGLLGVEGFFRWFRTTIDVAEGWFSLEPVSR